MHYASLIVKETLHVSLYIITCQCRDSPDWSLMCNTVKNLSNLILLIETKLDYHSVSQRYPLFKSYIIFSAHK